MLSALNLLGRAGCLLPSPATDGAVTTDLRTTDVPNSKEVPSIGFFELNFGYCYRFGHVSATPHNPVTRLS